MADALCTCGHPAVDHYGPNSACASPGTPGACPAMCKQYTPALPSFSPPQWLHSPRSPGCTTTQCDWNDAEGWCCRLTIGHDGQHSRSNTPEPLPDDVLRKLRAWFPGVMAQLPRGPIVFEHEDGDGDGGLDAAEAEALLRALQARDQLLADVLALIVVRT